MINVLLSSSIGSPIFTMCVLQLASTVPGERFEAVCADLQQALQRERDAQATLDQQTTTLQQLQTRSEEITNQTDFFFSWLLHIWREGYLLGFYPDDDWSIRLKHQQVFFLSSSW